MLDAWNRTGQARITQVFAACMCMRPDEYGSCTNPDQLLDASYCLDAPAAIPQGCMNLPAYGAGCVLRDRAFA